MALRHSEDFSLSVSLPDAACLGRSDLFGDELLDVPSVSLVRTPGSRREVARKRNALVQRAVAVCHTCPVLMQCRDFSSRVVVFGVAGGLPPEDPARARHSALSVVSSAQPSTAPVPVDPERALELLAEGMDHREVARELGCSDRTIRRIVTRTAIRQAPVPPLDEVPHLAHLQQLGPADVAYFRNDDPRVDDMQRPAAPSIPVDVDGHGLPAGRALQGGYDRLAAVTVAMLDLFIPAEPLTRDEIIAGAAPYVPTDMALTTWASATSQPTSHPNIRVLPPGMAAVPPGDRISRGARAYLLARIQGLADSRVLVPAPEGCLRISRPAWEAWVAYRAHSPAVSAQTLRDTLF